MIEKPQLLHLTIRGRVQGVGFRPFIYRLAQELKLVGWVNNSSEGVFVEVEGNQSQLATFLARIESEKPAISLIQSIEVSWLQPVGYQEFTIRASVDGVKTAVVLPDMATCGDCLQEINDPQNRRYRYPFTNCTNCGPRYTIIKSLPYDRANTSMAHFTMCPQCQSEYHNPRDRRFHAQPNACPVCGPHLELWDNQGQVLATDDQALFATANAIREGKIIAIKGLGGFHLVVNARNQIATKLLRKRKHRPDKPFALMYPHLDLVKQHCEVNDIEARLLTSPQSPILLLKLNQSQANPLDNSEIAPNNPYWGIMLPYTPFYHLLLQELNFPIIATSGNISDEPICTDNQEALTRLGQIADLFLVHNRPIVRPVDDAIARVVNQREMVLRCARGYAPLSIKLNTQNKTKILAVGGHLKNSIAIALNDQIFLSQHIGDLATPQAYQAFTDVIQSFKQLYEFKPEIIAHDLHPDYISTQYAQQQQLPTQAVQHHYAHILAVMAENQLLGSSALGIAWDGTGYGLDGTIWGGEFMLINAKSFTRIAHLRQFPLPGGNKAVKEPKRSALGLLYTIWGQELFDTKLAHFPHLQAAFTPQELTIIAQSLSKQVNSPLTSSMGRLFDGIAAIIGLCPLASYEGQAAMQLEFAINQDCQFEENYPFGINCGLQPMIIDWQPLLLAILDDFALGISPGVISAKFHHSLMAMIIDIAEIIGENKIILSGGCFQNKYLLENSIKNLEKANFSPYWQQQIPGNDGGIAFGQIVLSL